MGKKIIEATAYIIDEFGTVFPDAVVQFWKIRRTATDDWDAPNDDSVEYNELVEIEGMAYQCRFHANAQTKALGYPSRRLNYRADGKPNGPVEFIFSVDIDDEFTRSINSIGDIVDKTKNALVRDLAKKYK